MSFLQLMAIALALIVVLTIFFSNLAPALPLVFLGRSTVPIPIGLLFLGALSAGLITSLVVRLLMFWQRSAKSKKRPEEPVEFSYRPEPPPPDDWTTARPEQNIAPDRPRHDLPERFRAPEQFTPPKYDRPPVSDYVYDADYRVISQPDPNSAPVVGSRLSPDSEDWGFDFDEEDEPRR